MPDLTQQVRTAIEDAVRTLDPSTYQIIEAADEAPFGDRVYTLQSNSTDTAAVTIFVSADSELLTVIVGEAILLELPVSDSWQPLGLATVLDEVREVCRAASRGDVREEIWIDKGSLVRAKGFLTIDGKEILASDRHTGTGSIRRAERTILTYHSYGELGGRRGGG